MPGGASTPAAVPLPLHASVTCMVVAAFDELADSERGDPPQTSPPPAPPRTPRQRSRRVSLTPAHLWGGRAEKEVALKKFAEVRSACVMVTDFADTHRTHRRQ